MKNKLDGLIVYMNVGGLTRRTRMPRTLITMMVDRTRLESHSVPNLVLIRPAVRPGPSGFILGANLLLGHLAVCMRE